MASPRLSWRQRLWEAQAGTLPRALVSLASLAFLLRSYVFVARHYTSQAFFDFWFWVSDFQLWTEGHFGLRDLVKLHYGQHRIATTRLLLLLDSAVFGMNGVSIVVINLAVLAAVGLMLWRLARMDGVAGTLWDLPPLFWVALICAVSQVENIIFPFQVQFAITCFCAVGAASLLAEATRPGASRAGWLAAGAGVLGILAAFSMASGVLLAPGLLALLALRRARPLVWLVFAPLSALGIAAFFHHYPHFPGPPLLDWHLALVRIVYVGNFLASSMTGFPRLAAGVGLCALALFVVAAFGLARRFVLRGENLPVGDAGLLAIGIFVVLCGPAGTMTVRLMMGAQAALVTRYATMSLLFAAVLLGLFARWGARRQAPAWVARVALPGVAVGVLAVMNVPFYDDAGAGWHRVVAADSQMLRHDVGLEGPAPFIFLGGIDDIRPQVRFLHESGLNMFSPAYAPPADFVARLRAATLAALPACRGSIDDAYGVDDSAFVLRAWLADPQGTHTLPWVAALDAAGRLIGMAQPFGDRQDVQRALGMAGAAHGVETAFRLPAPDEAAAPESIRLVGYDPGAAAPLCLLPQVAAIGPVLVPPAAALQGMAQVALAGLPTSQGFSPWRFTKGKLPEPPPAPGPQWRAAPGAGEVSVHFSLANNGPGGQALALPFAAGPERAQGRIVFSFADGTRITSEIPWLWDRPVWRAAVLPASLAGSHGGVTAVDLQARPGVWLVVGAPVTGDLPAAWSRIF